MPAPLSLLLFGSALLGAPEERAIAYLAQEVPRWFRENGCYSCHNNGDAARALYVAAGAGYRVPPAALSDTTVWLRRPADWDKSRGDPAFSDKKLARIQFAASLAAAFEAGVVAESGTVRAAAKALLPDQESDGSWRVDAGAETGSPVTYGTYVASWLVRRTLALAGASGFRKPMAHLDRWFVESKPVAVPDAAAVVLALEARTDAAARRKQQECIELLLGAQSSEGGWGPFAGAPAEPYDTALALLALAAVQDQTSSAAMARGRAFLIRSQLPCGGWPETTRPAGGRSYAQHVSTSAWAALALVKTAGR